MSIDKVSYPRSRLRKILVVVLVCAGWFGVTEALIRLALPRPGFRPFDVDEVRGLKVPHPVRGFSYAPNFSARRTTADFTEEVSTNALGLRESSINLDDINEVRVLAVGDSFTEGLGVEHVDAWPAQLESLINARMRRHRPIRVINAGISAYNLRQIRLMAEELIPVLHPSLLIVGIYVEGYGRLHNPYVFLNGQTVISSKLPNLIPLADGFLYSPFQADWAIRVDLWLDQHFYTGAYVGKVSRAIVRVGEKQKSAELVQLTMSEAETQLSMLLEEIDRLRMLTEKKHLGLVVLLINHQDVDGSFRSNSGLYNTVITEYCRKGGVRVVNLLPHLVQASDGRPVFRYKRDGHWTSAAHKIAASNLVTALRDDEFGLP
jgi:hypothetical protein